MIPRGLFLADTSVIARHRHPAVAGQLNALGRQGLLATCVTIDLEVLYSARTASEYATIARLRSDAFVDLPLTAAVGEGARQIQAALAQRGLHRAAGVFEIVTAATADHYGAIVLHYDQDFEHIGRVSGQPTRWVVPPGTID